MSLLRKTRDDAIVKMVKQGATYEEVGKAFNISRQRAHQIFRERYPQVARQELDKVAAVE